MEWSRDKELRSPTCVWHGVFFIYTNQFPKKFYNKGVFGRMISYLNDKDWYQVYVPSVNKTVLSHDVCFKPERVWTSSVVETGLENAALEDLGEVKSQEDDTLLESSQSEKTLKVETEEEFSMNKGRPIRTVKWTMWWASGDYILSLDVGTHCCCWWWSSNVMLGSYTFRAEGRVGYDHEGRNECIGGKRHVGVG